GRRDALRAVVGLTGGIPLGLLVLYVAVADGVIAMSTFLTGLAIVMLLRGIYFVLNCYVRDRLLGSWDANRAIGNTEHYRVFHYGFRGGWMRDLLRNLGFHLKIAVICEVGLSYLGFGIQEPAASFGNILASHFDSYLNGNFSVLAF